MLVNHGITNEEEEATINVYQTTQSMDNTLLEFKAILLYLELSINHKMVVLLSRLYDQHVPCAVCHVSTRAAVLMIPAWLHCPSQWTLEYTGYL